MDNLPDAASFGTGKYTDNRPGQLPGGNQKIFLENLKIRRTIEHMPPVVKRSGNLEIRVKVFEKRS
ncbi:MAG: hypothetical protein PHH77_13120 [Victivallaceae bacterium]|nr:hypothetical protein [Victivallaceae bacterium]